MGNNSTTRAATVETIATVTYPAVVGPPATPAGNFTYGSFAGNTNILGAFSVGNGGGTRQIINVAPGAISAASTDAINGSQLYAVAQGINKRIDAIPAGGGGATGPQGPAGTNGTNGTNGATGPAGPAGANGAAGPAGSAGGPAGPAGPTGANGPAGPAGVNGTTGANGPAGPTGPAGANGVTGANGSTGPAGANGADGGPKGAVTYTTNADGTVNYNEVNLNPGGTGPTTITNVADGKRPSEAVNLGQLSTGLEHVTTQLRNELNGVSKDANAGTAAAIAMANMPQAFTPGKSMIAAGAGYYEGQTALSIGVSKLSDNGRWVIKFSGSADTRGKVGVGAGAGFQW